MKKRRTFREVILTYHDLPEFSAKVGDNYVLSNFKQSDFLITIRLFL